jgi:hypothetical protein
MSQDNVYFIQTARASTCSFTFQKASKGVRITRILAAEENRNCRPNARRVTLVYSFLRCARGRTRWKRMVPPNVGFVDGIIIQSGA